MTTNIVKVGLRGSLTIRVLDGKTGKELRRLEDPNLVCVGAKEALSILLVPASEAEQDYNQLWSLGIGNGAVAPVVSDTGLGGVTTFYKNWSTKTSNVGGTEGLTEVQVTIGTSEANNGVDYTEAGLFSRGDGTGPPGTGALMYARQVHAAVQKTAAISLEYTWRFQLVTA